MELVLGIGGVFFRARNPTKLAEWYREHLGVPVEKSQTYGRFSSASANEDTVWATFPIDTDYFGSKQSSFMINFRVRDLDAMLKQLREAGVAVDENVEEHEYGRFGWGVDPEGNRFELWEPRN